MPSLLAAAAATLTIAGAFAFAVTADLVVAVRDPAGLGAGERAFTRADTP